MEARLIQELPANERPLTLEEWRDEADKLQDLANKLMTEREALHETIATLRAELARERERHQFALNLLEEVKQCCLFAEDEGVGVTTEAHISEDLFERICAVLHPQPAPVVTAE